MLHHATLLLPCVVLGHFIELNCLHNRVVSPKEPILDSHYARDLLVHVGLLLLLLLGGLGDLLEFFLVGCNTLLHLLLLLQLVVSL